MLSASHMPKTARLLFAVSLLVTLLPTGGSDRRAVANAETDVPAATFGAPEFQAAWNRQDAPVAAGQVARSWVWGPSPGIARQEPYAEGSGGTRTVQYFDKARMELNSAAHTQSPWRVTTGLLVAEMVKGKVQTGASQFEEATPSEQVVAGDGVEGPRYKEFAKAAQAKSPDKTGEAVTDTLAADPALRVPSMKYAHFAPETAHNIPTAFWTYMHQTGQVGTPNAGKTEALFDWVYLLGYPITEAYWTKISIEGREYTALIQLYQRRTLTYVADLPAGWQVQMGNVGLHYYAWRYGASAGAEEATGSGQAPTPTATATAAQHAFVTISGDQFVYANAPVKLKGTNYWLSSAPFAGTWASWDGPKVFAELKKARDLGVNTVRVGLPFNHGDTMDVVWDSDPKMGKVSIWIQRQMTQLLQISSVLGMKVIFVLFEWYDEHPPEGSLQERQNINYLEGIVGPFANDDRVLAWDLHNEPDFYFEWKEGSPDRVIEWLRRMAKYVRYLDPNHPVTVGMGDYRSLWTADQSGGTALDFVDFASFHSYDAHALPAQVAEIRAHTTKPVLLEEMGWPTSPGGQAPPTGVAYDEPTQTYLYTRMLEDANKLAIAGVVQWSLFDFAVGSTSKLANYEEHLGLLRLDGSPKPAFEVFRQGYITRNLPSQSVSNLPLDTADHPNLSP